MSEHTPTPWEVQRLPHAAGELWLQIGYRDPQGHSRGPICDIVDKQWIPAAEIKYLVTPEAEQWANAYLIVRAVNEHDALKAQLAATEARAARLAAALARLVADLDQCPALGVRDAIGAIMVARAALAADAPGATEGDWRAER